MAFLYIGLGVFVTVCVIVLVVLILAFIGGRSLRAYDKGQRVHY